MAEKSKDKKDFTKDDDNKCNKFKKCDEQEKCYYETIYRPVKVKYVITTKKYEEQIFPCKGKHYTHAYNKKCHEKSKEKCHDKSKEKSKEKSRDW